MLKDIYKARNAGEKALEHLRAMIAENDAEMQRMQKPSRPKN